MELLGWGVLSILVLGWPVYLALKGYSDFWYIYSFFILCLSIISYTENWVNWEGVLLVNMCLAWPALITVQGGYPGYSFKEAFKRKSYLRRIKENDNFISLNEITFDELRTILIEHDSLKIKVKLPEEIKTIETGLLVPVRFRGLEKDSQETKIIKDIVGTSDLHEHRMFSLNSDEKPYLLIRLTGLCQYQYEWYLATPEKKSLILLEEPNVFIFN